MDKKESLELFEKGENAWNKWAESMLTERKVLESVGTWMRGDENQWNDETRSWHERAKTDFTDHKFTSEVNFRNFHFPGEALFMSVNFKGYVSFQSAKFHYNANFLAAIFFRIALFNNAEFEGVARFMQCSFKSSVLFADSSFKKFASFRAVSGKGSFSLQNVKFSKVPYFTEAHFKEAPQFDNVELKSEGFKNLQSNVNLPSHLRLRTRLVLLPSLAFSLNGELFSTQTDAAINSIRLCTGPTRHSHTSHRCRFSPTH